MAGARVDALRGRTLAGRYALEGLLGRGGMGAVYEAVHVVTARRVAVKVLHRSVVQAVPTVEARFLREAQAAATIAHPGIVDVLDAGRDEETGDLFLVLELLEGEDLDRALAGRRLSVHEIVQIIGAVLEPLAAAHAKGFVHRDIKPANIFLCGEGEGRQVKLLDFGIVKAQRMADITLSGALVGTVDYMSPEQARGEPVGPEADLWAAAATLFHALAGRPPFVADTRLDLLRQIGSHRAPSLGEVWPEAPPGLVPVVDRALSANPSERYPDAASLQTALRDAVARPARGNPRREGTDLVRPDLLEAAPTARAPAVSVSTPERSPDTVVRPPPAAYPSTAVTSPPPRGRGLGWAVALLMGIGIGWWALRPTAAPPVGRLVPVPAPAPAQTTDVAEPTPARAVAPAPSVSTATSAAAAAPSSAPSAAPSGGPPAAAAPRSRRPRRTPRRETGRRALPPPASAPPAPVAPPSGAAPARSAEDPLRSYE